MQSPSLYRKYAEECERIARESAAEHRAALLEVLSKAWRESRRKSGSRFPALLRVASRKSDLRAYIKYRKSDASALRYGFPLGSAPA
jgi:hypothetical protein